MPPCARFVPLECSDGTRPTKAIVLGAVAKRRGSPSSAAMVNAVRSSMPRKQRRRSHAWRSARARQARRSVSTRGQPGARLVHGARVRRWVCCSAGSGHVCARSHASWRLDPRLLGPGEATAVPEEKLREAVARPQEIGPDILAAPQQVAGGFFLLGRNVDGVSAPARYSTASWPASRRSVLMRSPGRRGNSAGAITSQGHCLQSSGPAGARSRTGPPRNSRSPRPGVGTSCEETGRIVGRSGVSG